MITYEQARRDHEYLWETYGPADDMTGGYVDQRDLWELMRQPTKATARNAYAEQVRYWFQVGPDPNFNRCSDFAGDPRLKEIAKRHDVEHYLTMLVDDQEPSHG